MKKSRFNEPLVFIPKTNTSDNTSKKQLKREINWFNSAFSLSFKTNICRTFLILLKQDFPKSNRFHNIFNKVAVKVNYTFMSNMASIISSHNNRLLRSKTTEYGCNCRTRENSPLQNQCLTPNLIYQADVENNTNESTKIYFGSAETIFKAERVFCTISPFAWFSSTEILSRKTKVQRCLFNESLPHIPNYILSTLITTRKQEFIIGLVILIIRDGSILINLESKIHMLK